MGDTRYLAFCSFFWAGLFCVRFAWLQVLGRFVLPIFWRRKWRFLTSWYLSSSWLINPTAFRTSFLYLSVARKWSCCYKSPVIQRVKLQDQTHPAQVIQIMSQENLASGSRFIALILTDGWKNIWQQMLILPPKLTYRWKRMVGKLEDYFPFEMVPFKGTFVNLQRCRFCLKRVSEFEIAHRHSRFGGLFASPNRTGRWPEIFELWIPSLN